MHGSHLHPVPELFLRIVEALHYHSQGLNIFDISLLHHTTNTSSSYSADDVFILPELKSLSMVPDLKWPDKYVIS